MHNKGSTFVFKPSYFLVLKYALCFFVFSAVMRTIYHYLTKTFNELETSRNSLYVTKKKKLYKNLRKLKLTKLA